MSRFLQTIGFLAFAVCTVFCASIPSIASAQVRLVSSDADGWLVRIEPGASYLDLARVVANDSEATTEILDMETIARSNPGRIIYVCYDNVRGERPSMSRSPRHYETCTDFARDRWFVAGLTYRIPRGEPIVSPEVVRTVSDPADRARIAVLEAALLNAVAEHAESEPTVMDSLDHVRDAVAQPEPDHALEYILIGLLLGLGIAFMAFFFVRREWQKDKGKEIEKVALAIRAEALKSKRKVENALAGMRTKRDELAILYRRRRERTKHLLVSLAKQRKLLRQCLNAIQVFQRKQAEELAHREQIPKLLQLVDDAHRNQIHLFNARARVDMVREWRAKLPAVGYVKSVLDEVIFMTYDGMLAEYKAEEERLQVLVDGVGQSRSELVDRFYALTGVRTEDADPDGRLTRSINAADKNAETLWAQCEAMNDLLKLHTGLMGDFRSREDAIKSREDEIEAGERELLGRIRKHEINIDLWKREHDVKSALSAFEGGLAKVTRVTEVEARMSELEGRMAGYERRARSAEVSLEEAHEFIDAVQPKYKQAMELLEGIKKGPEFLGARTIQMVEYIKQLEDSLGITRTSIFGGLPEIAYGSIPSKNKA